MNLNLTGLITIGDITIMAPGGPCAFEIQYDSLVRVVCLMDSFSIVRSPVIEAAYCPHVYELNV